LAWRRDLAKLEEELLIDRTFTPFEKNLEVWKQLWRVVEKADIVVQVEKLLIENILKFVCLDCRRKKSSLL